MSYKTPNVTLIDQHKRTLPVKNKEIGKGEHRETGDNIKGKHSAPYYIKYQKVHSDKPCMLTRNDKHGGEHNQSLSVKDKDDMKSFSGFEAV